MSPRDPQGAETRECEGNCERDDDGHRGPVVRVNVVDADTQKDFGGYWYCETAIAEDTRRGFTITRIPCAGEEQ